jgi:hypothetical protein
MRHEWGESIAAPGGAPARVAAVVRACPPPYHAAAAMDATAARRDSSRSGWIWLVLLAAVGALCYAPGLAGGYFADDFLFVQFEQAPRVLEHFLRVREGVAWYRPIEAAILDHVQARFGFVTLPIHLMALAAHVAVAWLVWAGLLGLGLPSAQARGGSLLVLVSQAGVAAVLGNDTLSQVLCTLGGVFSLYALHRSFAPGAPAGWRAASLAGLALALFAKEAGFGWVASLLALIAIERRTRLTAGDWGTGAAAIALAVVCLLMRRMAGAATPDVGGSGTYGFLFGPNVLVNLAMLAGMPFAAGSSVEIFDAARTGRTLTIALIGAISLGAALIALAGAWRSPRRRAFGALALLAIAAMLPVLPLRHVSELYVYAALPLLGAILGAGMVAFETGARYPMRGIAFVVIALFFAGQVGGVISKARQMHANGRAAAVLLAEATELVKGMPPGGTLWLVRDADRRRAYSVFRVQGVDLLRFGEDFIRERAGRPDVRIEPIEPDEVAARAGGTPGGRVVTVSGGHLTPFAP